MISPFNYRYANGIRCFFLKLYGAQIARGVQIHSRVRIQTPWNLALRYGCVLAQGANLHGKNRVEIGEYSIVDIEAMIRTDGWYGGERTAGPESWHSAPIVIGNWAFIGARAIVGGGSLVAEGEVIPPFSFRGMKLTSQGDFQPVKRNGHAASDHAYRRGTPQTPVVIPSATPVTDA